MDDLKLPANLRSVLEDFIAALKNIYRNDLVSVVLYGSASSGELAKRYSNINVMAVLNDTSLASLSKAYQIVNSAKFKMISPVFFTEEYIKSSLDVFPIEFLDIKENHRILYGKDVVKEIKVDGKNLRFQCEHELKSKLINIRRQYLAAKNQKDLESLLFKAFTSTLHIMRNLLRLKEGGQPPYLKEEILIEAGRALGVRTAILDEILRAKKRKMALTHEGAEALLAGFVKELETLSFSVDKL